MRILAITNLYPRPALESLAPYNRQQILALATSHDIRVIAPIPWNCALREWLTGRAASFRSLNSDGIEITRPIYYFTPKLLRGQYGRFFLASIAQAARELISSNRPDVIFSCWAHPDGWAATRLAHRAGLPSVIKVVGTDILVAARSGARRRAIAEGLIEADAVVAVSRDLGRHVISLGVPPRRVHVVSEGLNLDLFRPGDRNEAHRRLGLESDRPIILFVGNLLMSKGAGVLIEAMARLDRQGVPASCILVGRGRDEPALRSLIRKNALERCVTLVGPKPQADLPDWYRACDAVALPSFSEGIPNVLREAAACGRPYVATRVGGIPELADDHARRLVPPGDAPALAEALVEMLAMGPQPASPGISWGESADRLADVLRSVARVPTEPSSASC